MSRKSTTTVTELPEFAGKVFTKIYRTTQGKALHELKMYRFDGTEFDYKDHETAQFDYCSMEPAWPSIPADSLVFENEDITLALGHEQSCCECVAFESSDIPIDQLVGRMFLRAEKRAVHRDTDSGDETRTWYYFEIEGLGTCTMRWCGTSNGWYSTDVNLFVEDRTVYNEWMRTPAKRDGINSEGEEGPEVVN